jgi:hypothetical protein
VRKERNGEERKSWEKRTTGTVKETDNGYCDVTYDDRLAVIDERWV